MIFIGTLFCNLHKAQAVNAISRAISLHPSIRCAPRGGDQINCEPLKRRKYLPARAAPFRGFFHGRCSIRELPSWLLIGQPEARRRACCKRAISSTTNRRLPFSTFFGPAAAEACRASLSVWQHRDLAHDTRLGARQRWKYSLLPCRVPVLLTAARPSDPSSSTGPASARLRGLLGSASTLVCLFPSCSRLPCLSLFAHATSTSLTCTVITSTPARSIRAAGRTHMRPF
jgi:hypothetical protein